MKEKNREIGHTNKGSNLNFSYFSWKYISNSIRGFWILLTISSIHILKMIASYNLSRIVLFFTIKKLVVMLKCFLKICSLRTPVRNLLCIENNANISSVTLGEY